MGIERDLKWEGPQLISPGAQVSWELLFTLPSNPRTRALRAGDKRTFYDSLHWPGVGNNVAHARFSERRLTDGRRELRVDEIQSDWHKAGRRHGYSVDLVARFKEQIMDAVRKDGKTSAAGMADIEKAFGRLVEDPAGAEEADWNLLYKAIGDDTDINLNHFHDLRAGNTVPGAPFKGSVWTNMVIRRMIK